MLQAIIIDDEINAVRSLELLLRQFPDAVRLIASCTDPEEGRTLIDTLRPDLVFLDINMPRCSGFDLLKDLGHREFHLVFCTAHQEYALQALKMQASDYLLKPVDLRDLSDTLRRLGTKPIANDHWQTVYDQLVRLLDAKRTRVPLQGRHAVEYVDPGSILFIEARAKNADVYLPAGEPVRVCTSLKTYEDLLCREGMPFLRVHNSFIVNLDRVTRYLREDGGYVVVGGRKVPVSKLHRDELLERFDLKKHTI